MSTPFDTVIENIKKRGYHNHRTQEHSNLVSDGIFIQLLERCEALRRDFGEGRVRRWLNVPAPGGRHRKIDLFVGEPRPSATDGKGSPDYDRARICVENKSVVTAHRNADARFSDLDEELQAIHRVKPEAVLVATVMVGLARRFLNIPDGVRKAYRSREEEFQKKIVPRLSSGDQLLWTEFPMAISQNRPDDARRTLEKFRQIKTRPPAQTHILGYDFVLIVPVYIDNVNPPHVARKNPFGIDVNREYESMLERICKAYTARWQS